MSRVRELTSIKISKLVLGLGLFMSCTLGQMQSAQASAFSEMDPIKMVRIFMAMTEDVWGQIFKEYGQVYSEPKLVVFRGATQTACGIGRDVFGPFYCPLDSKLYIDLSFYKVMETRFKSSSDFAKAYVLAHEVGHHVQNQIGILGRHNVQQTFRNEIARNAAQVRVELQADCFAGYWAQRIHILRKNLEVHDILDGLRAANQIGDDNIARGMGFEPNPEDFTHGTGAQRARWLFKGVKAKSLEECNTFKATEL